MGKKLQQKLSCPHVSLMMLLSMMKDSEFFENFEVHRRTGRVQKTITWYTNMVLLFLSCETKWVPLLQCLAKLVKQKELTEAEAIEMTWQEKCELIRCDPVTCARYFDKRIQCFLNSVLKRGKRRPEKMNDCIHADFVAWFDTLYSTQLKKSSSDVNELPEDDDEKNDDSMSECESEEEHNSEIIEFRDGTLMRKRQKVLRYNKVSENENKDEHYRQLLMLFTSWR